MDLEECELVLKVNMGTESNEILKVEKIDSMFDELSSMEISKNGM